MGNPSAPRTLVDSKKRDFYDWLDMFIKATGISLAIFAAFQASATYKKDVDEKFLDQKMKFANDALLDAGQISIAQDWTSYSHALDVFGVIKHGSGIALFGNDDTYNAMVTYWQFCETKLENEGESPYDPVEVYNAVEPEYEKLANVFHKNVLTPEVAASIKASRTEAQSR